MKYISISLYRKVINHALAEGMHRSDFSELPTPPDLMEEVAAVPADEFFELHEMVDQALGPGFSVRVGQQMKIEDYGVLGLSWRTCSWAGEIFERSERYFKLLSNTYVFKIEKKGNVSYVYLLRDAHRRGVELSNEATLSATVVVLRAMTESGMSPIQVSFKHRAPASLESYEEAFRCPVMFNQDDYLIAYNSSDLEMPTAKADASINQFLVQRVDEETKGIEISGNRIAKDVAELIKDALPSGIPSIHKIADHMGMSNRTLTRRLSDSGKSYRDIIKESQLEIARRLLRDKATSIGEIAFQTGFSEQSAFNRAFKRWTGKSPVEYRKNPA